MLKRFGFFEENPAEAPAELEQLRREGPLAEEDRVLHYLQSGTLLMEAGGTAFDRLTGGTTPIGPPHVYSDGEWCWSADVIYYIRKYHIGVERQLIEWMQKHNWESPKIVSAEALVQANWLT